MRGISAGAPASEAAALQAAVPARPGILAGPGPWAVPIALAAFAVYWLSALILEARGGTTHFGADAHLYSMLVDGTDVDRITRFHPLTTVLAAAWMKLLAPLTAWLSPQNLYKAMYATVGAAGVWGATAAFAAVVPRRQALLLGIIYATSLGIWFFSSIEESKIVTTTLAAFYIAIYLHLRTAWSRRGVAVLTAILLLACLNEIVAAFLVAIPAVDALVQHGWNVREQVRRNWWIACHALAAPAALLLLEGVVNGRLVAAGNDPEGASHISMLVYYITQNEISFATVYAFAVRWLFFNMAAPSVDANFGVQAGSPFAGDFAPELAGYLGSPVSLALVVVAGAAAAACVLPGWRGRLPRGLAGVLLGLLAYAVLRALFFFLINPAECLLFASGVTLPHMLLLAVPFAASSFPWKEHLLALAAVLLFVVNATFIIGQ